MTPSAPIFCDGPETRSDLDQAVGGILVVCDAVSVKTPHDADSIARLARRAGFNISAIGTKPAGMQEMPIPIVTVIPGTESPVGDGITKPNRCLIRLPDGSASAAIVKELSAQELAAEIFCAHLLRGWGLKTPDVAIVKGKSALASLDIGYPNLKQRINFQDSLPSTIKAMLERRGAVLVASFPETPRAIAADEAIANRDRNLGNILWDGANVAWIDHHRALGLTNDVDQNKLVNFVLMSGADHGKIAQAAVQCALQLYANSVAAAVKECAGLKVNQFGVLVSSRLGQLAQKVVERFPQPNDLLNTTK